MKVLWLCNIMLPFIADSLGKKTLVKEGWLSGLVEKIIEHGRDNEITLAICFPMADLDAPFIKGEVRGIQYYGFYEDTVHPENYNEAIENSLKNIVEDYNPDIVHIFGTEFPHTLAMCKAFNKPNKTLIGIQGILEAYSKVYMAGLPKKIQDYKSFRDKLKKDGLHDQQNKFFMRAENEKEALKLTGHVTGRTDFDKEWTRLLAPQAKYHFMNETLRDIFYKSKWDISGIERHSIFVSQGNYPIKGLHEVLLALPDIIKKYPDTRLYVSGDIITANKSLKEKIKLSGYGKYLNKLIRENGLEKNIVFLGPINAEAMCDRYLKTHVFLCPSVIENSPNSVGEAMLLGVPTVSADVGGIHNLLSNNVEGILYQYGNKEEMVNAIVKIFNDDNVAKEFSQASIMHANITHNGVNNFNRLLEIYNEINLCI